MSLIQRNQVLHEEILGGDGKGGGGGGNPVTDWRASLPDDIKGDPSLVDLKDVPAMARSYINAQKLIGVDKIPKPTDKWGDAEWGSFYKSIGAPDKPELYEIPKDVKLADGLELDKEQLSEWQKEFAAAGLTKRQADRLLKKFYDRANGEFTGTQTKRQSDFAAAQALLKQEYGGEYDANVDIGKAVLRKYGSEGLTQKLIASGLGSDPDLIKMFVALGKATMDDRAVGAGDGLQVKGQTQAQLELNKLKGDVEFQTILQTREHPGHKEALKRWMNLHTIAAGEDKKE